MPPIVDCRSGQRVELGEWVHYPPAPDGESDDWKLLEVRSVGLFSALLHIGRPLSPVRDRGKDFVRLPGPAPANPIVVSVVRCPVRWFHPAGKGALRVILVPT